MTALPFKLLLITDWSVPDCLERIHAALSVGPGIAVQHRHPGATDRQFYQEGLRLKSVCRGAPLFINGRLDIALALQAHLHLTQNSLRPEDVRPHLGAQWLSAACHPPAVGPPDVDLLLVSPVFKPGCKPDDPRPPLGPAGFLAFAGSNKVPCFALGGITAARAAEMRGAAGIAVMSEIMRAGSVELATRALLGALQGASGAA